MKMKKVLPIYILMMLGLLPIFTVSCGNDGTDDIDTVTPPPAMELPAAPEGMVLIPAGEFQMGSNDGESDERPVHTVYLDAFYMDKYAVTNAQYKQFIDAKPEWQKDQVNLALPFKNYLYRWNGNDYPDGKANHPVVDVSWYAAMAYADWVEKRLPTEAEWEYAARGGLVGKQYPWGDAAPDGTQCNFADANTDYPWSDKSVNDGYAETAPVGSYLPNGYGLYDMAGNVLEWCLDGYNPDFYSISPRENPLSGTDSVDWIIDNFTNVKTGRVLRGGTWGDRPGGLRVADRFGEGPSFTRNYGFRCARAQ